MATNWRGKKIDTFTVRGQLNTYEFVLRWRRDDGEFGADVFDQLVKSKDAKDVERQARELVKAHEEALVNPKRLILVDYEATYGEQGTDLGRTWRIGLDDKLPGNFAAWRGLEISLLAFDLVAGATGWLVRWLIPSDDDPTVFTNEDTPLERVWRDPCDGCRTMHYTPERWRALFELQRRLEKMSVELYTALSQDADELARAIDAGTSRLLLTGADSGKRR